MLDSVIPAFVGAFAALVALGLFNADGIRPIANRWVAYLAALLVGALLAVVLAVILEWMVSMLNRGT